MYRHLHFRGVIEVPLPTGGSFVIRHHGFTVENSLFWEGLTGGWEGKSLELWLRLCQSSSTIVDVGANTGVYALVARAANPRARVAAVEPVARVFERLVENVRLNHADILCLPLAASDKDGTDVIFDQPTEHTYSVTVGRNMEADGVPVQRVEIQVARLDSLAEQHQLGDVDLIKIDVETHEPEVLRGARSLLERRRPSLLIEILSDEVGRAVEAELSGLGYRYFHVDERVGARPVERLSRTEFYNFLICQPEAAASLGLPVQPA